MISVRCLLVGSLSLALLALSALPLAAQDITFSSRTFSSSRPIWMDEGDLNGDGLLDFCVASFGDNAIEIYLGTGGGSFGLAGSIRAGRGPHEVSIQDGDGDGYADIFVARQGELAKPAIEVLWGDGTGLPSGFVQTSIPVEDYAHAFTVRDFDGDGVLDLLVLLEWIFPARTGVLAVYRGLGDRTYDAPTYTSAGILPRDLAAADFNRDGLLDVAVANWRQASVSLFAGQPDGSFETMGPSIAALEPWTIDHGDVNGDGNLDLVFGNYDSRTVEVHVGDGSGSFTETQVLTVGRLVQDVVLLDVDGDARIDLVVNDSTCNGGQSPGCLYVYTGHGDGTFALAAARPLGLSPASLLAADFDHDRVTDLALVHHGSDQVELLVNTTFERTGARQGSVNAGAGDVTDVLFLNDLAGEGDERRVEYDVLGSFELRMRRPPAVVLPDVAPYAVYLWPGDPGVDQETLLPLGIGLAALPLPLVGGPDPPAIWNNAGRRNRLGVPNHPSQPAPDVFFSRAQLSQVGVFYIQGIIFDPGSAAAVPASVTNGILGVPVIRR